MNLGFDLVPKTAASQEEAERTGPCPHCGNKLFSNGFPGTAAYCGACQTHVPLKPKTAGENPGQEDWNDSYDRGYQDAKAGKPKDVANESLNPHGYDVGYLRGKNASKTAAKSKTLNVDLPYQTPMRPQQGVVRRPSTDQRRIRRQIVVKKSSSEERVNDMSRIASARDAVRAEHDDMWSEAGFDDPGHQNSNTQDDLYGGKAPTCPDCGSQASEEDYKGTGFKGKNLHDYFNCPSCSKEFSTKVAKVAGKSNIEIAEMSLAEGPFAKGAIDSFSASAYKQVYDALSPENRAKIEALPLEKAMTVVWKLINRSKTSATEYADQRAHDVDWMTAEERNNHVVSPDAKDLAKENGEDFVKSHPPDESWKERDDSHSKESSYADFGDCPTCDGGRKQVAEWPNLDPPCKACHGSGVMHKDLLRQMSMASKTAGVDDADVYYGGHPDDGGIALKYVDPGHQAVYDGLGTDGTCTVCGKSVIFDGFGPGDPLNQKTPKLWRHIVRASKTAMSGGYYLVGPTGGTLSGPYPTLSEAEANVGGHASAIEYKSGESDAEWDFLKAKPFPFSSNTVNG